MDNFKEDIKEWVSVDNEIKKCYEQLKELRQNKQQLTEKMYSFASDNELETSTISISDGRLKFQTTKQIQPLSLSYIEECLSECIDDEHVILEIMKKIKTSRSYKFSNDVKRYINKE
jgi:hypothetical protein